MAFNILACVSRCLRLSFLPIEDFPLHLLFTLRNFLKNFNFAELAGLEPTPGSTTGLPYYPII